MKPVLVSATGLLISALLPPLLLSGCSAPSKPQAAVVESTKSGTIKKPRKMFPYRMGGDWAGGGKPSDEIDPGIGKKIRDVLDKHGSLLELYDPTGLTPKVVREDLAILQRPDASNLRNLDIGNNELSDEDIEPLADLQLTILRARENDLHDLHALKKMKTLRKIDLGSTPLNQAGLSVLGTFTDLNYLCLDGNNFHGLDLSGLGHLKKLRHLGLVNCLGIHESTLDQLREDLPGCKVDFTDGLDESFYNLRELKTIETTLMHSGKYAQADGMISGLIDKWVAQPSPGYRAIAQAYRLRGRCCLQLHDAAKAVEMFSRAQENYLAHVPDDDALPAVTLELADVLEQLHKTAEARAEHLRADAFWVKYKPGKTMQKLYRANSSWLQEHAR
ncbi:MAG: hypothetical protein JSS83_03410 [Cyanobacteria bacterium SZAS LIN-3]|nr:hypothetical protein [Cyanobacteria bacterium SZAS LIN-3]